MGAPTQKGTALKASGAPAVAGGVVVKDTYRKRDTTEHEELMEDTNGETVTVLFSNVGFTHTFDLALAAATTEYVKSDTIVVGGVTCLITSVETQGRGGKALVQSIEAIEKVGLALGGA